MTNRKQELDQALEAMHFGFRAMIYRPDQRLAELGLSRVHHRLLYFVARNPGCSVNELLEVMRVSKQYLHRPLKTMVDRDYVGQSRDTADGRIKRLRLTSRGKRLEHELTEFQRHRFESIFRRAGPAAEKHWRKIMAMLQEESGF